MMRSSRQVAVLTGQLTRVLRSSTTAQPTACSPAVSVSSLRAGYLTQSQGIATSQARWSSQEQSGESSRSGPSEEAKRRAKNFQIATGAACAFFGASYILYRQLSVKAAEATVIEKVCVCLCVSVCVCCVSCVRVCVQKPAGLRCIKRCSKKRGNHNVHVRFIYT